MTHKIVRHGRCWNCATVADLTKSGTCALCAWPDGLSAWDNPAVRMPRRRKKKTAAKKAPPPAVKPARKVTPRRKAPPKVTPAHPCEIEGCRKIIPAGESPTRRYCSAKCSGKASAHSVRMASRRRRARVRSGVKRKDRVCKWRGCDVVIPASAHASRLYCSRSCASKQWNYGLNTL